MPTFYLRLPLIVSFVSLMTLCLHAQEAATNSLPETNPNFDHAAEAVVFHAEVDKWRETLSLLGEVLVLYHNGDGSLDNKYQDRYRELQFVGRQQFDAAFRSAVKLIDNAPREYFEAAQFLLLAVPHRYQMDWYEGTGEGAEALISLDLEDPKLIEIAGVSFYATAQFDKAERYLKMAEEAGTLDPAFAGLRPSIPDVQELWDRELEFRAADDAKGDLPRVKLVTTRGDVVIELFEDQAPNTVANFIDLVENHQYDGGPFYQVLGRRIAMIGDAAGDRAGSMGFFIDDENVGPEKRTMFRGSLAMAKLPDGDSQVRRTYPDTASSHCFVAYQPLIQANPEHTIFGRVIEGIEHLCALTRLDPSEKQDENAIPKIPDRIVSAEVIRKRSHPYEPKRTPLETADSSVPKSAPNQP